MGDLATSGWFWISVALAAVVFTAQMARKTSRENGNRSGPTDPAVTGPFDLDEIDRAGPLD